MANLIMNTAFGVGVAALGAYLMYFAWFPKQFRRQMGVAFLLLMGFIFVIGGSVTVAVNILAIIAEF
jgi:hypothetical protein